MNDKIIDLKQARAPHDFARKEQKLASLRDRFKNVLDGDKPRPKSRSRRKGSSKKPKKR